MAGSVEQMEGQDTGVSRACVRCQGSAVLPRCRLPPSLKPPDPYSLVWGHEPPCGISWAQGCVVRSWAGLDCGGPVGISEPPYLSTDGLSGRDQPVELLSPAHMGHMPSSGE